MNENRFKNLGGIISLVLVISFFFHITRPDIQRNENIVTHGIENIALTFDDGPHPLWMPLLADTLSHNNAKGTFFIVGKEAVFYPEIVRQTYQMGHQIASHSMNHPQNPNLSGLPINVVYREINDAEKYIGKICDSNNLDFRPPGGGINQTVLEITQNLKHRVIWWSIAIGDYDPLPIDTIINRIESYSMPGSIMLLHQRKQTIAALEKYFIKKQTKYNYITVKEMVK